MVIDKVTDFAARREVQIVSVAPSERDSKKFYDKVVVTLNIVVKGYKKLCLFINDIENSPYALRLEKWSGFLEESTKSTQTLEDTEDVETIRAQITVASIIFKNEQQ